MAHKYKVGDYVVYPAHGVGKLNAIELLKVADVEVELMVIFFEKDRMTLKIPTNKAEKSGLRPVSTKSSLQDALKMLSTKTRIKKMMWSRRAQEYENKINSGNPVSLIEVIRELHKANGQAEQSYSERQIFQAAVERLAREISAVNNIDEPEAFKEIERYLNAA